jgi:ATP-dependent protease Clp ATPase subunit
MSDKEKNNDIVNCSFCGRSSLEVNSMVAGPGVYVCDRCFSRKAEREAISTNVKAR